MRRRPAAGAASHHSGGSGVRGSTAQRQLQLLVPVAADELQNGLAAEPCSETSCLVAISASAANS